MDDQKLVLSICPLPLDISESLFLCYQMILHFLFPAVPYYRRTWDGYTLRLRCNRGTKINILYAMYGRIQKSIYSLIYCKSCSAKLKMKGYCQAKATCLVKVSTKIFGNPCRGIHKYLKVKYTCIW